MRQSSSYAKDQKTNCITCRWREVSKTIWIDSSYLDCSLSSQMSFFFLHLSREAKLKYVYYINLYLVMDYFIQLLYGYGLFSTDPAKRVSILGLSAYFFQLLLFFIPSVVILLLSPCFHYWWRRGLLRLWNHNMFLAIVVFYTLCNYSPAIPIAFSNWGLALFSLSAEGTNNLLTGFIRNMLEVEAQHE